MSRNKGNSILELLDDYVIVDIETTGLDPCYDQIIEIGALRVKDNKVVDKFNTLVQPSWFTIADDDVIEGIDYVSLNGKIGYFIDDFIINLTGITNEMLLTAPNTKTAISDFFSFINEKDIIVGHNVNFDINFIYDVYSELFNKEFKNDFLDTMRLSKCSLKDLEHHRLKDVSKFFNINYKNAHRAFTDCEITNQCYMLLKDYIIANNIALKKRNTKAKDIKTDKIHFDESSPIFQKTFAFTGTLENMTRSEAMQLVVDNGGINGDGVTRKTNYLVLGNNDYCTSIKDGKSNKQKKAESLILKGQDLHIISENVFCDMINDLSSSNTNENYHTNNQKNRAIKGSSKKNIHTFGCCSRYLKCSDAKECVHEDKQYAKGCAYYSNLKNGKIFYGKNRNV